MLDIRRVIGNAGSIAVMRVVTAAVSFLFFVYAARQWDQERLGAFATAIAFFFFLQAAPLLGLHVPLIRDLARRAAALRDIGPTMLLLASLVAVGLAVVVSIAGRLLYVGELGATLWLVGACLLPSAVSAVAETALIARERMRIIAMVNAGELLVRTAGWMLLLRVDASLAAFLVVLLLGRVLTALTYLWSGLWKELEGGKTDRVLLWGLWTQAPVYAGILLCTAALGRADFVLLSKLGTFTDVGAYAAPYKVHEAVMMLPTILTVVLFPTLARVAAGTSEALRDLVRQLCRFWVNIGVPCAIVLGAVAIPLVRFLFGPEFEGAGRVLIWLAIVPVVAAVDFTLAAVLHVRHEPLHDLRAAASACTLYIVVLVILIPLAGYQGAAAATLLATLAQMALHYRAARRVMDLQGFVRALWPGIAAGLLMISAIVVLRNISLAAAIATGLGTYVIALVLVRGITVRDLRELRVAMTVGRSAA